MRKLNKTLYGASLVALAFSLSAADVNAQTCTPAPSCDTLGFTKSSADCSGRSTLKCPFDTTKLFCADEASSSTPTTPETTTYKVGDIVYKDGVACGKAVYIDSTGKHGTMVSQSSVPGTTKELVAQNCNAKTTCGADWGLATCYHTQMNGIWTEKGCITNLDFTSPYDIHDCNYRNVTGSGCSTGYCEAAF